MVLLTERKMSLTGFEGIIFAFHVRASLLHNYHKLSRIFSCTLLIRNHMIFVVRFGVNKHLQIFQRPQFCWSWKKFTTAYLFRIALEIIWLPILKCIVNCAHTYPLLKLRALYLNSALVWRKARALWKYNEIVLTNHGAPISLNIL